MRVTRTPSPTCNRISQDEKSIFWRYKVFQNNNGIATVRRLENEIQGGIKGFGIPFLNGVIAGDNHD